VQRHGDGGPRQNVVEGGEPVKAVVARGWTVEVPTGESVVTGRTAEGKEVRGQHCRSVGPRGCATSATSWNQNQVEGAWPKTKKIHSAILTFPQLSAN
jgi:hypothetical protein